MSDQKENRIMPWLRLLRLPNLFTAPGDSLAGYFLASAFIGNKTVSLQELVNGKLDADGELSSYSYEDLRNIIILPDVTFGGVFPDMTVDFFWDEFLPALMEDEEEDDDWDYYYDDDDYYYNDPYLYE